MKITINIIWLIFITVSIYPQTQLFEEWGIIPPDTNIYLYASGVSDLKDTEREAISEAEQMAIINLAQDIFMIVDARYTGIAKKDNFEIHEFAIIENNISTRIILSGVNRETIIRRENNKFIAYTIVYITHEEADKARIAAENEITAMNVFYFFKNNTSGISPFASAENPEGYTSWLKSKTVILSIQGSTSSFVHLETFIKNLFPTISIYSGRYDREPVRFIYGSGKIDFIVEVLQRHGISFVRENPMLIITNLSKLSKLAIITPSVVHVSGIERIYYSFDKQIINNQGVFFQELTRSLQSRSSRSIEPLYINLDYISSVSEIVEHAKNNNFSGRYLVAFYIDSFIESGIAEFGIPPYLFATVQVVIFDLMLRDIKFSTSDQRGIPVMNQQAKIDTDMLLRRLLSASLVETILNSLENSSEL